MLLFAERVGLHFQMDELLLDSADWGRILPQILQLFVHKLAIVFIAKDRQAVVEL